MTEQNIVIENANSFNLTHIFECGQCFRWNKNTDGSYTGVVKENVINIKMINRDIYIESYGKDDLKKLFENYFDMDRDYDEIKK